MSGVLALGGRDVALPVEAATAGAAVAAAAREFPLVVSLPDRERLLVAAWRGQVIAAEPVQLWIQKPGLAGRRE